MLLSVCWYLGGLLLAGGLLCLIRPMRWLRLPTRRRAAVTAVAGLLLASSTLFIGVGMTRVGPPVSLLDRVVPAFQFSEQHSITVAAPAERVYRALFEVTPEEIAGYRTLTWIRCLGRCPGESILNADGRTPILDTALRTSFRKLAETPD